MMIDQKTLGDRLRELRKLQGVSQKQLADELKITQSAISRLENGEEVYASVLLAVLRYHQQHASWHLLLTYLLGSEP